MTLSELRFVVAVAKERNFRRASEKCFVSQPALSLAIKKSRTYVKLQSRAIISLAVRLGWG
jgi:LysR family hydrogen peroxide-inducible transcriptional activator